MSASEDAWHDLLAAIPAGWYVGRPSKRRMGHLTKKRKIAAAIATWC